MYLDTHIVVWLAAGLTNKLSKKARAAIDSADELLVSPMVRLELAYLHEIKRISEPPVVILHHLEKSLGLINTNPPLEELVSIAVDISWTRDAFDRLIVSECIYNDITLITKDAHIRKHFKAVCW